MFGRSRPAQQDGTARQVDPLSAAAEQIVPGWKNTGANERHWQGWGIANERSINPATGRPRSDDKHMNELSRQHREYLAARRAREAAIDGLMAKLRAAVLRRDAVVTAATLRQLAALGISDSTINAAFRVTVTEARARARLAAGRRGGAR